MSNISSTLPNTASSRRINRFAGIIDARSYLEVGVARGATFSAVNISDKVAVDPNFSFEFRSHQSDSCSFYQLTSDIFFAMHCKNRIFDMVFIDGLHTFEQTLRDFCNIISRIRQRSIVIIDDVFPNDVYSSLVDPSDAHKFRAAAGNTIDKAWHGDVYKVVFAIHDFFPQFSFATIKGTGNPQMIVWQQPREKFSPRFNNLETISRLSYFDIHRYLDVFNIVTEDEAFALVANGLNSAPVPEGQSPKSA